MQHIKSLFDGFLRTWVNEKKRNFVLCSVENNKKLVSRAKLYSDGMVFFVFV